MKTVFRTHEDLAEYAKAVDRYLDGGLSVPVFTARRPDLAASAANASSLYVPRSESRGNQRSHIRVEGDVADAVRRLARALPSCGAAGEAPREVLIGTYPVIEYGRDEASAPRILTGRDLQSLSWMIAKQLVEPRQGMSDLVITDLDSDAALEGHTWIGPEQIREEKNEDFLSRLTEEQWRRALFHGNGAVDSSNLGSYTLCGRFAPVGRRPIGYGPSCHFGQGCYKPERGLVPVGQVMATEIALMNCFSGASASAAIYSADYNLLLAAVDGPAQRILFTMTACDVSRPEIMAWAKGPEGALDRMERSLADINPFPALAQVGVDPC